MFSTGPPAFASGVRSTVLHGRFVDMASPAQGLTAGRVVGVLRRLDLEWHNMIALESPGLPTALASPAVTLEHLPTCTLPSLPMQPPVMPAHAAPK